jgi:hypothetical protein
MTDREIISLFIQTAKETYEKAENHEIQFPMNIESANELATSIAILMEKQIPKEPKHFHRDYGEHEWEKNKDGEPDEWAWMFDVHNGPVCQRCGYSFCEGCNPNGWTARKCVIDVFMCPGCGRKLDKFQKFCDGCGQGVKWGNETN